MRLFLDDMRDEPEDWFRVYTVAEAVDFLENWAGLVRVASLDHDLGLILHPEDDDMRVYPALALEPEGYKVTDYMAANDNWPTDILALHSSNAWGRERMAKTVERYGPYDVRVQAFVGGYPATVYTMEGVL